DDAFGYCFYLLAALAQATREPASADELAEIFPGLFGAQAAPRGGQIEAEYTAFDLVSDFSAAADRFVRRGRARTDFGEMAQFGAAGALSALCARHSTPLFGSPADTVREALRKHSTEKGFATFAHDFFSRFARRFLEYHLSRELSNHVGVNRRFAGAAEHNLFLRQLDDHCRITTGVIRQFAAQWFAKHLRRQDINSRTAQGFIAHAVDKIVDAVWHVENTNGH